MQRPSLSDVRWYLRGYLNNRRADVVAWWLRWLDRSPDRGY